ncbi:MAG: carbamoyl-phosphate synthase large subunit [Verrucomicrobiota bacterium]|jgi:carbamoyl-phosphate synthase large subunit|nr:carbamoyl-phosphate synthase large subunit [Verrucomicrobiota bacterium]
MPRREDISKILLIGAGPIVIGQACEFDYSGAQACKSLREEGYEVVLVNSNPATIMTDPGFAERTYIEPLTVEALTAIIRRERPDALLPTMGGQTALNLAVELDAAGILDRYRVGLIGATTEVIRRAEDRGLFKKAMEEIHLEMPKSASAHCMQDAWAIREQIDSWPVIIRPGFTMGGAGGGIARTPEEFEAICANGLALSPVNEVLIEESVLGWKEFEMEVMRDRKGNACIVCSIENLDPMGVHTGDSVTVAPAQTLTDREYQRLRDASLAVMRVIGVETGGANVQFAMNPHDGRLVVIEMNPRVSRSSALASKATGFPIAKIAAKLAVGYTLDELPNDITKSTPACFEPSLDYVVVKVPRFAFEKFQGADDTLTTQMKSVGETMAMGRTFKQALQKAFRSLEIGRPGLSGRPDVEGRMTDEEVARAVARPSPMRWFHVREALARGRPVKALAQATAIDPWFLRQMAELVAFEAEIRSIGSLAALEKSPPLFAQAKEFGFSDKQLAQALGESEAHVREARERLGLLPQYSMVDTCAAEFDSATPYFYSSYGGEASEVAGEGRKKKIMILGGGPNRIGQGIEFDYCCVHACRSLREAGMETVMVNSNPETVSTDYDTSDRLYFEPVTLEDVVAIYRREGCHAAIVQFGGQIPLNLAMELEQAGVNIIGTRPEDIEKAEDREFFKQLAEQIGVKQPANGTASNMGDALALARRIGFPVLVRPSFVLGGRAMAIVYTEEFFEQFCSEAFSVSEGRPVLIDQFLEDAVEVDVDCIADGQLQVIGAVMEHIEKAGIHSGDSACIIPPRSLSAAVLERIRSHTVDLARVLNVRGLMNVQYAVQNEDVYVLEANPRASRTIPFVSKATGIPLAGLAARVMAGETLASLGFTKEVVMHHVAIKEAVLPFARFPGCHMLLTPEMHSTGEVMGIDLDPGMAFVKSQQAAGNPLPHGGGVFVSVSGERPADRTELVECARELVELGYRIFSTCGTATFLREVGIPAQAAFAISEGRPHVLDLVKEGSIGWIVNVPSGCRPQLDEVTMRTEAIRRGIPITTTLRGLRAALEGLHTLQRHPELEVMSLQEYNRDTARKGAGCT